MARSFVMGSRALFRIDSGRERALPAQSVPQRGRNTRTAPSGWLPGKQEAARAKFAELLELETGNL